MNPSPDGDDEMSEEELEVVVGGLARPWRGTWDSTELGEVEPSPGTGDGTDSGADEAGSAMTIRR
jgi:hypothetical protein